MLTTILLWFFILIFLLVPSMIFLDYFIVQDLSEENKFKKWWRKHVIADYN